MVLLLHPNNLTRYYNMVKHYNILDENVIPELLPINKQTFISNKRFADKHDTMHFSDLERFLLQCEFNPNEKREECCNWIPAKGKYRYGQFRFKGKSYPSHRASYQHYIGPISNELVVCHTCDNQACVNPLHLRIGNMRENMLDCIKKKRHWSCMQQNHKNGKFTDEQVLKIRSIPFYIGIFKDLAIEYNVRTNTITDIYIGKTYSYLPTPPENLIRRGRYKLKPKPQ